MRRFVTILLISSALAAAEPITREAIEKRLASLQKDRDQMIATLTTIDGAIIDCKYWLDQIKSEAPKTEVKKSDAEAGHPRPDAKKEWRMEPTTHAESMNEIKRMLKDLALTAGAGNETVLAINQMEQMKAKNGGYPLNMYHARLDPIMATNRKEEEALGSRGYSRTYINRFYPKYLYRRNMDSKYEPRRNAATGVLEAEPFVETMIVKSEFEDKSVKSAKVPKGCGPWLDQITAIEPIPESDEEDLALKVSRLEGQLAEARRASEQAAAAQQVKRG
jgi:hypothetical protein